MTQEERTKICSTCTEHKIDLKTGLYCGKTGNKPEFVNACYDYKADEVEIEPYDGYHSEKDGGQEVNL